jgi:hypothetical protein
MSTFETITGASWARSLPAARKHCAERRRAIQAYAQAYKRLTLQSDSQSPTPSLLRSSESYADAKDGMAALALTPLPGGRTPGVLVEAGSGRGAETCPDRLAGT